MIVAIMQPYFFPYIGYFQLMDAVDMFVFYDQAQYMKGGWINRNRILRDGAPAWWTLPIERDDYRLRIRQRRYRRSSTDVDTLLGQLGNAYRRAPHVDAVLPLVAGYLRFDETIVSRFNQTHLFDLAARLGVGCRFIASSEIEHDESLAGQARVIELCRRLGATRYVNAIGGTGLYNPAAFAQAGIELAFVQPEATDYAQDGHSHVPFLSILDVLMFNTPAAAGAMLGRRRIIEATPA